MIEINDGNETIYGYTKENITPLARWFEESCRENKKILENSNIKDLYDFVVVCDKTNYIVVDFEF